MLQGAVLALFSVELGQMQIADCVRGALFDEGLEVFLYIAGWLD